MNQSIRTDRTANLIGSLFMVGAMAGFAVEDALIKAAAAALPLSQVIILFGFGGALVFAVAAHFQGQPLYIPEVRSKPMLIRVVFEITGRLFYFLAIAFIPLSSATVILQATPLVVVASAVFVFGEKVGWQRWTAIALGLIGVVIIVQPGADGFTPLSILAIIGMIGFAGRDLASRVAPANIGTSALGVYGFLAIILAGAFYAIYEQRSFVIPDPPTLGILLAAVGAGVLGYASLMKAMRTGEVSAVTPFRYTRLLFGVALGVLLFGESLTTGMLAGSALIVVSGLFILWRGQSGRS